MKKLTELEMIVLRALKKGQDINQKWNQILEISDFGSLPYSINRSLPLVFNSLRGQTQAQEYQRLAGFTKRNWAENVGRLNYILPILDGADKAGIKVVVLKGMAINFLRNDFASRVMGDADLLIHKSDEKAFAKIIRNLGFKATYQLNCPHKESEIYTVIDEFRDAGGNKIDIHSTSDPDSLFKTLWEETLQIKYEEVVVHIPNPPNLMLHSLSHGFEGVAQSDLMQTGLDFLLLEKFLKVSEIEAKASIFKVGRELKELLNFFEVESKNSFVRSKRPRNSFIRELANLKRIRREREINFALAYRASRNRNLYRIRYFIWIYLGAPRPLEEYWIVKRKGFVRDFADKLHSKNLYEIRFCVKDEFTQIRIDTKGLYFAAHQIYANGKLIGSIESDSQISAILPGAINKKHEISIRQPYGRCEKCTESILQGDISLDII